jgi:hypothetical protein
MAKETYLLRDIHVQSVDSAVSNGDTSQAFAAKYDAAEIL